MFEHLALNHMAFCGKAGIWTQAVCPQGLHLSQATLPPGWTHHIFVVVSLMFKDQKPLSRPKIIWQQSWTTSQENVPPQLPREHHQFHKLDSWRAKQKAPKLLEMIHRVNLKVKEEERHRAFTLPCPNLQKSLGLRSGPAARVARIL